MIIREQVKSAVHLLLDGIGEMTHREGLAGTPDRVANMYYELFSGYDQDPHEILDRTFDTVCGDDMVIVRDIQFYSHCEHHMVPFFGKVHIGYIPGKRVVGISKLARLVECYAHRLQIQERMTHQIAEAIEKELDPLGVMVVIEAEHLCMKMRGVKNPCADTVTSHVKGAFKESAETRAEFLSLIRR
jgi:GTP cyclohydrolase I